MMKRWTIAAAALALGACGQTTAPAAEAPAESPADAAAAGTVLAGTPPCSGDFQPGEPHTYACANNISFTAAFELETACATVNAGGQTYRLPNAASASGARYSDGAVEFWEHQGEARLTGAAGGPYENCRAPAAP